MYTYAKFIVNSILLLILLVERVNADSYDDLIYEVSGATNISDSTVRKVIFQTFLTIRKRLEIDQATSIPDFGRFSAHEKEKKSEKDKDGFWRAPKTVRTMRFTPNINLKRKLEAID